MASWPGCRRLISVSLSVSTLTSMGMTEISSEATAPAGSLPGVVATQSI
jgi:hypothetical protein